MGLGDDDAIFRGIEEKIGKSYICYAFILRQIAIAFCSPGTGMGQLPKPAA
jgi:hypothetical protein